MEIDLAKIAGIGEWMLEERKGDRGEEVDRIYRVKLVDDDVDAGANASVGAEVDPGANVEGKVFLVVRPKTLEVRCERNLAQKLQGEYETVMESRYFGRGGIEIVPSGQLSGEEIDDLVRLSYNLTTELAE